MQAESPTYPTWQSESSLWTRAPGCSTISKMARRVPMHLVLGASLSIQRRGRGPLAVCGDSEDIQSNCGLEQPFELKHPLPLSYEIIMSRVLIPLVLTGLGIGALVGCSDPGFPGAKLPPVDTRLQRQTIDRSRLTLILANNWDQALGPKDCGRVRSGQAFNFQWDISADPKVKSLKEMPYFLEMVVPEADGRERLVASGMVNYSDQVNGEQLSYRFGLVAPATSGKYLVRLRTPLQTISESNLEVF